MGDQTERGLTSPPNLVSAMPKRIHRVLQPDQRRVESAAEVIDQARPTPLEMRCLNPFCATGRMSRWPSRGRPSPFCCRECRDAYEYERNELLEDRRALEETLEAGGGSARQRQRIASELARVKWSLARYAFAGSE